jgi:phosphohistidine phosphatase SixA
VRVFLVRHAKAEPGYPDELRALTPAGHARAGELGAELAAERPAAVISSPLVRARQTAEPIAAAAGLELREDERLSPGADADDVRAIVEGLDGTVVLVGHQPDLGEIVHELTGREVRLKTGTYEAVEL